MPKLLYPEWAKNQPGVFFKPDRTGSQPCAFQNRLNFANAGLSAAYKEFWKPVPRITPRPYISGDSGIFIPELPEKEENWFDALIPIDVFTQEYSIRSDFKDEADRIQNYYNPNKQYALHPALAAHWDSTGGSRNENNISVFEINPNFSPQINLYLNYKRISRILKGESLVEQKIPKEAKINIKQQTDYPKVAPQKTISIKIKDK